METKLLDGELLTLEQTCAKYGPLLGHIAKKLFPVARQYGYEMEDLKNIGAIGLIKAYRGYEPERGYRFMTYAFPKVHGEVLREVRDRGNPINYSRDDRLLANKILRNEWEDSSVEEIIERTDSSRKNVIAALAILKKPVLSIEKTTGDGKVAIKDTLGYHQDFTSIELNDFVRRLPANYKQVLLLALKDKSQNEIAGIIGCSQTQVSRYMRRMRQNYKSYLGGLHEKNKM